MNKPLKYSLILLGALGLLWTVARITNTLHYYSSPSTANEPAIMYGERFLASSLVKPKRFDFICYKATLPMMGEQTVTHRLCGLPGDKIEIRNGVLFINGENLDSRLSLMHNYHLSTEEYFKLKDILKIDDYWVVYTSPNSVELPLSDDFIRTNHIQATRKVLMTYKDEDISKLFAGNFNQDKLGPIFVPEGKYFVLGDNRHNAQDSRYLGFVDESKFVATVLGK
jgi:signal peptidase I